MPYNCLICVVFNEPILGHLPFLRENDLEKSRVGAGLEGSDSAGRSLQGGAGLRRRRPAGGRRK